MFNFHESGLKTPPLDPWDKAVYNFQRSDLKYMSDGSNSSSSSASNFLKMCWDPTFLKSERESLLDHKEENLSSSFESLNIWASSSNNSKESLIFNEDNTTRDDIPIDMNPTMMFPQTSKFFNDLTLQPNQPTHGMSFLYPDSTAPSYFQSVEPVVHHSSGLEHDYFTYPEYLINLHYNLVTYFIERINTEENGDTYTKNKIFIQLIHPSGIQCHVNVQMDPGVRGRSICTFKATEAGTYMAFVRLDGGEDVNGSPLKIYVSRNYCNTLVTKIFEFQTRRENVLTPTRNDGKELAMSWGIDVDRFSKKIYIADKVTHKIHIFTYDGIPLTKIETQFNKPTGVAVDHMNKRLIVSDKDNHQICFMTLDGQLIKTIGRNGDNNGEFNYPWGIAISPSGELIAVADSKNHRIQLFDKNGNFLRKYNEVDSNPLEYRKHFDSPRGICFDNNGQNIYVSDFNLNTIFKLNIELTEKNILVSRGKLRRPQGLIVDIVGNILICDSRNNRIRVVSPDGAVLCNIHRNETCIHCPQNLSILRGGFLTILDSKGVVLIY